MKQPPGALVCAIGMKGRHAAKAPERLFLFSAGRKHWLVTIGCCALSFLAGVGLFRQGRSPTSTALLPSPPTVQAASHWQPIPGDGQNRWGILERQRLPLYRPDDAFDAEPKGDTATHWFLCTTNVSEARRVLEEAGLGPGFARELQETNRWTLAPGGYVLHPTDELVGRLSAPQRAAFYPRLAACPENRYHRTPVRLSADSFTNLLSSPAWPQPKAELLRQLAYVDRGTVSFADIPLLLRGSPPEEAALCLKELWRIPAVQLRLRLEPGCDLESLVRYWGPGGHARVVRPLLRSVSSLPQGGTLSVSDLLPRFARQRFLRFGPGNSTLAAREDCFWTAMNFFNQTPDPQFTEWRNTQEVLLSRYVRVTNEWSFGDVILILDGQTTQHMCVYMADDVVFTKNGAQVWQPWVFMNLEDVLALYPPERNRVVVVFRRKA